MSSTVALSAQIMSDGPFSLKTGNTWLMIQTEKWKMISHWMLLLSKYSLFSSISHEKSTSPHAIDGLSHMTCVAREIWPDMNIPHLNQGYVFVFWVLCTSLLPWKEYAPTAYCPFILGPKIERHEVALNSAWSRAAEMLTHHLTGKDINLLFGNHGDLGNIVYHSAQANALEKTFPRVFTSCTHFSHCSV